MMSGVKERGLLIVLEGLDRCGKSTQVDRLVDRLQASGRPARLQKFPDRSTTIGKMIDSYLQSKQELDDRAVHLLFSANRWECAEAINRDLANGLSIVTDRYAFSGIAFSAAKGLPFEFCANPDRGLPLPDLTLYLTLSPQQASARSAYGTERYETLDMQAKVKTHFQNVADAVRQQHGQDYWCEVSADGSKDQVADAIWEAIGVVLERERTTLGRLWQ